MLLPVIHEDRMSSAGLPVGVRNVMDGLGLVEKSENGNESINFCGMVGVDDEIHIFMPRNSLPAGCDGFGISEAVTTMRALERYAAMRDSGAVVIGDNEGARDMGILPLAKSLLEDYISQGIYVRRSRERQINRGRPDWKRTMSRTIPLHTDDGVPVYPEISTTVSKVSSDDLLTHIHASVIRRLGRDFSWWLTGRADLDISTGLEVVPAPRIDAEAQVALLRREMALTYSEREIRLFKHLVRYLENGYDAAAGQTVVGLKQFQHCWEEMLRQVLPDVIDVNRKLPKPAYQLANGEIVLRAKGMITDIVMIKDDVVTVVDAKYYKATTPENAPGWGDMVKQFFYALGLQGFMNVPTVRNLFIFPGRNGSLVKAMVVDPMNGRILSAQFPPIECFYFDPVEVMRNFVSAVQMNANLLHKPQMV